MKTKTALFASLLVFTQLSGASLAVAAGKKTPNNCKDILSISSPSDIAQLSKADINKYFKFIKSTLRLPTLQEVKALGLPQIAPELVFGSWGKVLVTAEDNLMKSGQVIGSAKNQNSIFTNDQIEALVDVFYKKLKANVKETNVYPPSLQDFALYLGFRGNEVKAFKAMFDEKNGLFLGYDQSFKTNAMRWKNFRNFFNIYPDQTVFTEKTKTELTRDIQKSPAMIVAGYVSGQPLPEGLEKALYTMQKAYSDSYDGRAVPVVTTPAYGIASGLPEEFNDPANHRYVCPQAMFLQDTYGSAVSVNRSALPNRKLIPQTGLPRIIQPGETMVIVHPQTVMFPVPADTNYPSMIITTGAINETGHNVSNRAIGAQISAVQNELGNTSVLIMEKITGNEADGVSGLETDFRPRSIPFIDHETIVDYGDGEKAAYPAGFVDLNKLYGVDGKVYDLPLHVIFGDDHYPLNDRGLQENFYRQFLDPVTGLKRTDGKPADILSFVFNDHFNGDWFSSYTEKDQAAKAALAKDPLESNLDLHLRNGAEIQKDLQLAVQRTRGYVPDVFYMHSNHDSDRLNKKLSTGSFVYDPANAEAYTRLKKYQDEGKDAFREYLMNYVGVSYNDHVHVMAPGEPLRLTNMAISHGHIGGVFGKPVSPTNRRAAQGAAGNGHTHVAMQYDQILNAGHNAQEFGYSKGWFKQGYQAIIIQSPLHAQVLYYKDGSFYGSNTHGNADLEFRPGYPNFKPLPVDAQTLPGQANKIDQYH